MSVRKELRPVTIDWSRLDEWVATVDSSARELLFDALHKARSADRHRVIVARVREVLAEEAPGRAAVAVVFDIKEGDEARFLTSEGTVLFTDGSAEDLVLRMSTWSSARSSVQSVRSSGSVRISARAPWMSWRTRTRCIRRTGFPGRVSNGEAGNR